MRRLFQLLHAMSAGCGRLPLIAGIALLLVSRLSAGLIPPAPPRPVAAPPASPDLAIIDSVLAQRAPDLGLTLRQQLGQAIAEEAPKAGYDPLLVLAIIDVESDFDVDAISNKRAKGLMQIQPTTLQFLASKEGLRLTREEIASDPSLEVRLGIRYLRALQDRFGDLDVALMAYNAGPRKIRQAQHDHSLDTFRRYPALVRRDFRHFRRGNGLGDDWAFAQRDEAAAH
jgi:soluble lytic murein transglycosylase